MSDLGTFCGTQKNDILMNVENQTILELNDFHYKKTIFFINNYIFLKIFSMLHIQRKKICNNIRVNKQLNFHVLVNYFSVFYFATFSFPSTLTSSCLKYSTMVPTTLR